MAQWGEKRVDIHRIVTAAVGVGRVLVGGRRGRRSLGAKQRTMRQQRGAEVKELKIFWVKRGNTSQGENEKKH